MTVILIAVAALAVAAVSYASYRYFTSEDVQQAQYSRELIEKVSVQTDIPKNELPAVATISQSAVLKKQPFFVNAQDGDLLLLFRSANKAVLYREQTNQVINTGGLSSTNQ